MPFWNGGKHNAPRSRGRKPDAARRRCNTTALYCAPSGGRETVTKLSRRELARLAAGMTATHAVRLKAQTPAASTYIGPLTGVVKGLEDRRFDPVAYTRDLYAAAPRQLRFRANSRS